MTDLNTYTPVKTSPVTPPDVRDTNQLLLQMLIKLSKIETHLSVMTEMNLDTSEEDTK